MLNRRRAFRYFLYFSVLLLLFGCGQTKKDLEIEFARRSILDRATRMLTIRYDSSHFVAYDLGRGILRKVWRGGVWWNGTNFNSIKTIQPQSWGPDYWQQKNNENPWLLEKDGRAISTSIDFKSYTLQGGQIVIAYHLVSDDGPPISIKEKPILHIANGLFNFNRQFQVSGLSGNDQLSLSGVSVVSGTQIISSEFQLLPFQPSQPFEVSGHGSRYWLDRSGCGTCHEMDHRVIGPSYLEIANRYPASDSMLAELADRVKEGSTGIWGEAAMIPHPNLSVGDIKNMLRYILSLRTEDEAEVKSKVKSVSNIVSEAEQIPGFGVPLDKIHPIFDLITIRSNDFQPRVGGMDFDDAGNLYLCTWDSIGAVYKLKGVTTGDTNQISISQVASGLGEPLGLKMMGSDIVVSQRNEITRLIDTDGDEVIDVYEAFCDNFGVTQDFHEFTYGLIEKDGYIYASLGLAMRLMQHELQHPDRGTVIKIDEEGYFEKIIDGLRQPNGIGFGPGDEIFITENQGRWVPACKLIHVKKGEFHGCLKESGDRFNGRVMADPVVWLPQDDIGNSPSQPVLMHSGIFSGQIIFGEVTHGGIKRVSLDEVNGAYQGCAFRFCQGLEAGINRMVWGPDGRLYVGGVGMNGGWSHRETQFGLQCLQQNDEVPLDIHSIEARSNGFKINFTKPLASQHRLDLQHLIQVESWYYKPTKNYGGPKLDQRKESINGIEVDNNGKQVILTIDNLRKKHVYHFYFSPEIHSNQDERLWAGDAWYTLNQIPEDTNL